MPRSLRFFALALAAGAIACGGPQNASPPDQHDFYGQSSQGLTYCPGSSTLRGIDVSQYQGTIDWATVKTSGIDFAIARAAHVPNGPTDPSTWQPDSTFATNWQAMKAAGLIRGAYQYFVNTQDAAAQAQLFLETLCEAEGNPKSSCPAAAKLGAGDLPPVLDVEDPKGTTTGSALETWLNTVQNALGRRPIIYTGAYYWSGWPQVQSANPGFTTDHPLWLPNYCGTSSDPSTCAASCPPLPAPWTTWIIHQYSDKGTVAGITQNVVDLDVFDGDYQALNTLAANPTCTAMCSGSYLVQADCTRTDCGAQSARCVSDAGSPRCVADACPVSGTADVCLSENQVGHCSGGNLASTENCGSGEYCSAAGSQVRCVSSFCVPSAGAAPVAHVACYTEPTEIAHCDANGQLELETCPAGEVCTKENGTWGCAPPACPATGDVLTCIDDTTLGSCSDGEATPTLDCSSVGGAGVCVRIGAAHCASAYCVKASDTTATAHDVCLPDGQMGHCDAQGVLGSKAACPAGDSCPRGTSACVAPPASPTPKPCGCADTPAGALALAVLLALLRRRRWA